MSSPSPSFHFRWSKCGTCRRITRHKPFVKSPPHVCPVCKKCGKVKVYKKNTPHVCKSIGRKKSAGKKKSAGMSKRKKSVRKSRK